MTAGHERAALVRMAAAIRAEMSSVDRVIAEMGETLNRHTEKRPETVVVHGTGGMIHDFYTGIEKAVSVVTPALNGIESGGESWHRDLLRAATLDLPGVRPPVLGDATAERLSEYLAFRHVYRNLYAFNLRWERVKELAAGAVSLWPAVRADLDRFAGFLEASAEAAGG